MSTRKSTTRRTNLQLVPKEPTWQQIEQWARTAVASGIEDKKRQQSLILLLDSMANATGMMDASSIALLARNAAFGNADSFIDDVIDQTLAPLRNRRAS